MIRVAAVVLLILGLWGAYFFFWHKAQQECVHSGGTWKVVGYSVVATGKSVSVVPDYGCVR